nr:MAG TPA: hypothetical protein [Caudoviricetes sp.]
MDNQQLRSKDKVQRLICTHKCVEVVLIHNG